MEKLKQQEMNNFSKEKEYSTTMKKIHTDVDRSKYFTSKD